MTLEEYFAEFKNEIEVYGVENGVHLTDLLLEKVLPFLDEQGVIDGLEPYVFYNPKYGRIDGLSYVEDRAEIVLLIADYHSSNEITVLGTQDLLRIQKQAENFFLQSLDLNFIRGLDETSLGYAAASTIYKHRKEIDRVRIVIVSNRRLSRSIKNTKDSIIQEAEVIVDVWDINRIYQNELSQGKSEDLFFDFEEMGYVVKALEVNNTEKLKSYLCVVPGALIADLYEEHGARLIEANVRSFLQFKGNVNKGIRNTIRYQPELFFSYNNGLTATAREIECNRYGEITSVRNLQIVNGGQTTASLFATRKAFATKEDKDSFLDGIYVQMKLNVLDDEEGADKLISDISRFANTQNKINDSDFASNHPFHRAFEESSRRILAPAKPNALETKWFYERARGSYLNAQSRLTLAQKKTFLTIHPKSQLIAKTDLAKTYLIFNEEPHNAIKGAEIAFREFTKLIDQQWQTMDGTLDDLFYKDMIAKHIAYQACKNVVYDNNDFMGNTKATITAYTLSVLVSLLKKHNKIFDFSRIWRAQTVPVGTDFLFERISLIVNDLINKKSQAANMAVLSFAKSKNCFEAIMAEIQRLDISLDGDELSLFISPNERRTEVKEAKQQRKLDKSINTLTLLTDYSVASWRTYLSEVRANRVLTENELSLLEIIPRYLEGQTSFSPSAFQLRKIKTIMERLDTEYGVDMMPAS